LGTSAFRSSTTMLSGMSLAITFHVAREASSACLSKRSWAAPRNADSSSSFVCRFGVLGPL